MIPRKNRPGPRFAIAVLLILVFHLFNINSILITKAKRLLQHEAKRKKFQNQDSVISEKFASKVKILIKILLILDKMLQI